MAEPQISDWVATATTFLGGSFMAGLIQWFRERRKMRLDADVALQEAIDRRVRLILEDDEKTIKRQQDEMVVLRVQVSRLLAYVGSLVALMRQHGIPVPPEPPN